MHMEQYIQHKFQRQYVLNFTIQEVPHQFKSIQNSYKSPSRIISLVQNIKSLNKK